MQVCEYESLRRCLTGVLVRGYDFNGLPRCPEDLCLQSEQVCERIYMSMIKGIARIYE